MIAKKYGSFQLNNDENKRIRTDATLNNTLISGGIGQKIIEVLKEVSIHKHFERAYELTRNSTTTKPFDDAFGHLIND